MSTLSVCMIVKDEEEFLIQCIDSVKSLADEIIVVDTGSTDATIEIARQYTPFVYEHEWIDFSTARNQSLSYMSMEWGLWIDADEELEPADIPLIKYLLTQDIDAIACWMLSANGDGTAAHPLPKFFRKDKAHFKGIVHNQCVIDGKVIPAMVRFYHHGYNLDHDKMVAKWDRSEKLLLEVLDNDPHDMYSWRNLVRNYRARRDYQRTIETAMTALSTAEGDEVTISDISLQMIWTDMASSYHGIENHGQAEATYLHLLDRFPENIDANFGCGELYRDTGQYAKAIPYYERYIQALQQAKLSLNMNPIIVDNWGSAHKAYWALKECYVATGQKDKAWMAYRTFMLSKYEVDLDACIKFAKELYK